MKNKIAIIGSGALGTALGKVLTDSGHKDIVIYGIDKNELSELSEGKNTKFFPITSVIPKFKVTNNLREAVKGAKYIVLAVPSSVMHLVVPKIIELIKGDVLMINGSKGFYPKTHKSLHVGIGDLISKNKHIRGVVSLIGPSHAEEIVKSRPTMVAAVDDAKELCKEVQTLFSCMYFKVYVQTDVKGAEVGAAYKNVLAIASGIANGLDFGINSIAALLTRGLSEMRKFNELMGGESETIMGLTGIGDLIVTATSSLSRNFTLGTNIAKIGVKKALDTKTTVEGVLALKHIKSIADEKKIELPIVNFLYKILFDGCSPDDFVKDLWMRKFKSE